MIRASRLKTGERRARLPHTKNAAPQTNNPPQLFLPVLDLAKSSGTKLRPGGGQNKERLSQPSPGIRYVVFLQAQLKAILYSSMN